MTNVVLCNVRVHVLLWPTQYPGALAPASVEKTAAARWEELCAKNPCLRWRVVRNTLGLSLFLRRTSLSEPAIVAAGESRNRRGDAEQLGGMEKLATGRSPPKWKCLSHKSLGSFLRSAKLHLVSQTSGVTANKPTAPCSDLMAKPGNVCHVRRSLLSAAPVELANRVAVSLRSASVRSRAAAAAAAPSVITRLEDRIGCFVCFTWLKS